MPADGSSVVSDPEGANGGSEPETPPTPVQTGPVYATATTTVNVRSSDSETADKLGKVSGGTKVDTRCRPSVSTVVFCCDELCGRCRKQSAA